MEAREAGFALFFNVVEAVEASLGNGVAPRGDAFFQLGTDYDRHYGGASQAAERAGG